MMAEGPIVNEENGRESRLRLAITNYSIDELYELIEEKRELLDRLSKDPFPDTPLHIAAAAGKTDVVMEMAILKPSFTRKLNSKGYSPMHLALEHEHYGTVRSLMAIDPNLIRVRGRCGITPLHYVAGKEGDIELKLLAEFLYTRQSSIEDLTNKCETAVHVAVKNHNLNAFKVLLGWLKRESLVELLNWKDQNDNTVLHIAVSEVQLEIIKLLIGYVKVNAKNFQGKTAIEIFQANPSGDQDLAKRLNRAGRRSSTPNLYRSQFLSMELTFFEKLKLWLDIQDESVRKLTIGVATLVATATYQAMLTPPGGFWQDNSSNPPVNSTIVTTNSSGIAVEKPHKAGEIILNGINLYMITVCNTMVFLVSIIIIWFAAIPLMPRTLAVYLLMTFFGYTYLISLVSGLPKSDAFARAFIGEFYWSLLCVVLVMPGPLLLIYSRRQRRIDVPRRRVENSKE